MSAAAHICVIRHALENTAAAIATSTAAVGLGREGGTCFVLLYAMEAARTLLLCCNNGRRRAREKREGALN